MDLKILKESKTRIITAIAMLVVVAIVAFINNIYVMWGFLGILYMVALYESMNLFDIKENMIYILGGAIWISLLFVKPEYMVFIMPILITSFIAYKNIDMKLVLPALYPTVSFIIMFSLYKYYGLYAFLYLLVVVASTDSFAYFVGKKYGKTKFTPTSPNKTIEGVIGGVVIGSFLGMLLGVYFGNILYSIMLSILVSLSSVFGDLFESYLKRKADVKDSGNIFPGHGGVLDRLDGYLFASIIMFVLLRIYN